MTKYLKVEGRDDLVREVHSKAILSTDLKKLQEHREKKQFFKSLITQREDINTLKNEIHQIKELLQQIVKREN